jgi:hypothetical protein
VINRELRGQKDITLGRVAELAHVLGRKPLFSLPEIVVPEGSNIGQNPPTTWSNPLPTPAPAPSPQASALITETAKFLMAAE